MREEDEAIFIDSAPEHHWASGRNDWMLQTPSFGPEDEGLVLLAEDELLEAVAEDEVPDLEKEGPVDSGKNEDVKVEIPTKQEQAEGSQADQQAEAALQSKSPSRKRGKRCVPPPALTLAEAESAGILRPRTLRVPGCSVLTSSKLRGQRRYFHGPGVLAKRCAEGANASDSEKDGAWHQANSMEVKAPPKKDVASPTSPVSATKSRPKTPEVSSDYRLPTKSWMARIPSETSLEQKRQERNRIVVAKQITPLATVRATFKGKSLLEERWIGNLDDSEADTEMSLPAVLAWFRRTDIYKHTLLTDSEVVDYVQQMMCGRKVAAIVSIANRRSNSVSPVQFQALVHWIAQHKGISFSECIAKLVNHPGAQRTRLEHYFAEFAHGSSSGFMTVYEFTRFCKVFGLFKLTAGRFVEGDVQFLFTSSGEGKAVDLEGFRRILGQVAKRINYPLQDLLHLLGEKEAQRSFHTIGK